MTDKQNYFTYTDNTTDDNDKTMENLHKQIIIDGVDVSGCHCYVDTSKEYSCGLTCSKFHYRFCEENPNCHYKKYKRKEQECEEFKEEKQGLIKDWEEKKNLAYKIACKNEKLKQTLTEIKEIAERCGKRIPLFEIDEIAEDLKQILQKISECEVE